ncbi:MAG: hypothetical protein EHM91_03885, partial [Planctomycetota bacterium]
MTGHHRVKSILTLALLLLIPTIPDAQDVVVDVPACLRPPAAVVYPEPAPGGPESIFEDEVWAKIGERTCLNCHVTGGDAAESKFILRDPALHPDHLQHNRQMFEKMASLKKDGKSRLLVKVSGGLDHGGGVQLKPGSTGYRILEQFVGVLESGSGARPAPPAAPPFFQGVRMASPDRLYRRLALSLAGRLPTAEERETIQKRGAAAIDGLLDGLLKEEAFFERLKEGFNDIFLTMGYNAHGVYALGYDHLEKSRHWNQNFYKDNKDLSEKEKTQKGYKLTDDYYLALRKEPYELIKYIVKNDRPFTEIVTADYIMMSPYTSRGYGIFETLKDRFKNVEDPFEYIPAKLPALTGRDKKVQKTGDGIYPSAGLLTMFQYLRRFPTTETNRNRLRARMYYSHFLGIDVM